MAEARLKRFEPLESREGHLLAELELRTLQGNAREERKAKQLAAAFHESARRTRASIFLHLSPSP